jgi:plasmid stability protein
LKNTTKADTKALVERQCSKRIGAGGHHAAGRRDIIDIVTMERKRTGQLIVRNVEDDLIRALKVRAARKGRSAEAEHREILREALATRRGKSTLKDLLLDMPQSGDDADFDRPRDLGRKTDL